MTTFLGRLGLYFHTIRHLRLSQIGWQLKFRLFPSVSPSSAPVVLPCRPLTPVEFVVLAGDGNPEEFRFLNVARRVDLAAPDWIAADMPKLWCYNLHYFDYALDTRRSWEDVAELIDSWIGSNPPGTRDAWEPYTASLRIANWIKFLLQRSQGRTISSHWLQSLWQQTAWLSRNLERHILANHFFKNLKALIFAGVYLDDARAARWLADGVRMFDAEMREQFLADGAHYERSPMYHSICTEDLLDVLNLVQAAPTLFPNGFGERVHARCMSALRWLELMCMPDGDISLFNDSALGIAAPPNNLFEYARRLGVPVRDVAASLKSDPRRGEGRWTRAESSEGDATRRGGAVLKTDSRVRGNDGGGDASEGIGNAGAEQTGDGVLAVGLEASGYFVIGKAGDRMIVDCGEVGPDYQPGHTHCDTLSFELALDGRRVIVDSGVHDYEASGRRRYSRSTAAHNTVCVDDEEQSEIWGVFRVARCAHPLYARLEQRDDTVRFEGAHDGYRRLAGAIVHQRVVQFDGAEAWTVEDDIQGSGYHEAQSTVHFHPDLNATAEGARVMLRDGTGATVSCIEPEERCTLRLERGEFFPEFGKALPNDVMVLTRQAEAPFQIRYRIVKSRL